MKTILTNIIIVFLCCNLSMDAFSKNECKYWEDFTEKEKQEVLSSDISKIVKDFYNKTLEITDNDKLLVLLDSLDELNHTCEKNALHLYLFTSLCQRSDAAVSEVLGNYCQNIILSNPDYVINYLNSNTALKRNCVQYLGSELYFKERNTSKIKYNYKQFKEILIKKLGTDKNNLKLNQLFAELEEAMHRME